MLTLFSKYRPSEDPQWTVKIDRQKASQVDLRAQVEDFQDDFVRVLASGLKL